MDGKTGLRKPVKGYWTRQMPVRKASLSSGLAGQITFLRSISNLTRKARRQKPLGKREPGSFSGREKFSRHQTSDNIYVSANSACVCIVVLYRAATTGCRATGFPALCSPPHHPVQPLSVHTLKPMVRCTEGPLQDCGEFAHVFAVARIRCSDRVRCPSSTHAQTGQ